MTHYTCLDENNSITEVIVDKDETELIEDFWKWDKETITWIELENNEIK